MVSAKCSEGAGAGSAIAVLSPADEVGALGRLPGDAAGNLQGIEEPQPVGPGGMRPTRRWMAWTSKGAVARSRLWQAGCLGRPARHRWGGGRGQPRDG